ncbi:hypothetical protein [Tabrizicola soli]|uniref:Uncharacterized protein n=1 Tax=Tabrizicola soli TaxID=2185115 RepID=A0ABV7DUV3_9RHOB|nr:hypothetical protein [Tabrizicola soli]
MNDGETVSFSDGGDAVTRKGWFQSYLARQPQVVNFGEMDLGPDPMAGPPMRPGHNIPDGHKVDRKGEATFFAARRIAREKGISFADAVDQVIEGGGR